MSDDADDGPDEDLNMIGFTADEVRALTRVVWVLDGPVGAPSIEVQQAIGRKARAAAELL